MLVPLIIKQIKAQGFTANLNESWISDESPFQKYGKTALLVGFEFEIFSIHQSEFLKTTQ